VIRFLNALFMVFADVIPTLVTVLLAIGSFSQVHYVSLRLCSVMLGAEFMYHSGLVFSKNISEAFSSAFVYSLPLIISQTWFHPKV
jgi:hypothetical protein